ncbi:cell division protein ZapA [Flaviaesturariibacter aridisoli]|uniref:Cell division protein ZapA n=1 Tax=Flaviaesturariibacter aridisoli TaxID=2545761 RepID=A0A4R4E4L8_9BACT|nr:cell division protein ZapA [Flaviaesturariibacter aridisoli]TCZ73660.1 cell division protein ZapA [Flaviaesturariibacter aridisoli]
MELIPVNLVIADRTYRLKIQPKDEAVVRHTAKTINDKLVEFKTAFAGKDMQDYIAMVLIWFATQQNASITHELNETAMQEKLAALEKLVDGALGEEGL